MNTKGFFMIPIIFATLFVGMLIVGVRDARKGRCVGYRDNPLKTSCK
jgi:hypothetical protein